MIELKDQMNHTIRVPKNARIVSLVPSQTELLHYLGCDENVVGITKFCIHPKTWHKNKIRVGGTKNIDFDKIAALEPDLIIANKEENTKSDIEQLQLLYPVYISDITSVEEAFEMIAHLGKLTEKTDSALELIELLKLDFNNLPKLNGSVLYFIWSSPYMVAGPNTFIGQIIKTLGLNNVISAPQERYVTLSESEIETLNPDLIFLSSEPYPFKEKDVAAFTKNFNSKVIIVDGEMFSWYGSRMEKMKAYFSLLADEINTL